MKIEISVDCRALLLWRWVYTKGRSLPSIQSSLPSALTIMMPLIRKNLKLQAHGQGMGRHSEAEVIEMGIKDLRAISNFLGNLFTNIYGEKLYLNTITI